MSTLFCRSVFDDVELDVLLYLFSYLSVNGQPPMTASVRQAVEESGAVGRLIARGHIHETDAVLVPNREYISWSLDCVLDGQWPN